MSLRIQKVEANDQELIVRLANIYLQEWGWQYGHEYGIYGIEEMCRYITRLVSQENGDIVFTTYCGNEFIATVAISQCDLKAREDLSPWIACLYVSPPHRKLGYGKTLMQHACDVALSLGNENVYLWCYTLQELRRYSMLGFVVISETTFNEDIPIWIMQKHL
jgi:GNAT superfamily N-acetyltransferase